MALDNGKVFLACSFSEFSQVTYRSWLCTWKISSLRHYPPALLFLALVWEVSIVKMRNEVIVIATADTGMVDNPHPSQYLTELEQICSGWVVLTYETHMLSVFSHEEWVNKWWRSMTRQPCVYCGELCLCLSLTWGFCLAVHLLL